MSRMTYPFISKRLPQVVRYNLIIAALALAFTGCKKNSSSDSSDTGTTVSIDSSAITSGTVEGSTEIGYNADDLVENSTFSNVVTINFGSTITISNPLSASGVNITQSNGDVTITSTTSNAVEYQLSGTTTNGSVKVYSDKKFKLTLNGVNITNNDGPAINIQSSKRSFIVVADNTTNTLTDGSTYATSTEDMKGTLFSEGQIIFTGNGSLTVKGNNKHGIASDDYVRIRSGSITVSGAAKDGIHTNDAFIADGGTLTVSAQSDGIEAEEGHIIINGGTLVLNTADDGITASYTGTDATITPYVNINGGSITIKTTGGEGIESKSVLTINKGTINTNTVDDGLNARTALYINGGSIYCYSSGNDAMDSNGTFTITGGKVIAAGAKAPEAGIDCDARTLKITGGIVVGIGGATSGPSATASTVHSVVMGSGTANQIIHIESSSGTEALTFLAPESYSTLLFASAKLKGSTTYNVYTSGSATGTNFNGLYLSGSYVKGTKSTSFTTSSMVTQIGGSISRN
ncbi:carbohydrate-binding domain-containing protein [Mucilaginibacter robiniae]|uniref:Carbohydrate-binding domain-containing protein n=1 Tax=Mucilaginibacter robiniae TaxID=2728022 RepID=A0A7L5E310_9SPHI|nr:carbohydrate-binding domain-containing protein [Mucilaginibacter robiniae]QJD97770.1 carbohydrate-binding domain-containing protein [Mucilaginibacter robiniae]